MFPDNDKSKFEFGTISIIRIIRSFTNLDLEEAKLLFEIWARAFSYPEKGGKFLVEPEHLNKLAIICNLISNGKAEIVNEKLCMYTEIQPSQIRNLTKDY